MGDLRQEAAPPMGRRPGFILRLFQINFPLNIHARHMGKPRACSLGEVTQSARV